MSYYQYHWFFCTNQRAPDVDRPSCANCSAAALRDYAKSQVKAMDLAGPGGVRVNIAGCLDRCEEGPVCVIYPEETWYTYLDEADLDEIIESHLKRGQKVTRLLLKNSAD